MELGSAVRGREGGRRGLPGGAAARRKLTIFHRKYIKKNENPRGFSSWKILQRSGFPAANKKCLLESARRCAPCRGCSAVDTKRHLLSTFLKLYFSSFFFLATQAHSLSHPQAYLSSSLMVLLPVVGLLGASDSPHGKVPL